ncbi:MAG: hypothetical protein AAB495_00465 [Patescibacteria group bacterium]
MNLLGKLFVADLLAILVHICFMISFVHSWRREDKKKMNAKFHWVLTTGVLAFVLLVLTGKLLPQGLGVLFFASSSMFVVGPVMAVLLRKSASGR